MSSLMLMNPRKRRTTKRRVTKRKTVAKRKTTPVRRRRRAPTVAKRRSVRRRNPSSRNIINNAINNQIKPAAIMAVGALGVDLAYGYGASFLPPVFTDGIAKHITKGVGAVLLSTLVANTKLVTKSMANDMAKGALTVTIHDALKETLSATGLPLNGVGYYSPAALNAYVDRSAIGNQFTPEATLSPSSLNAYITPDMSTSAFDSSLES